MEIPVVTFVGYITYTYFLKTTVELKPRQRGPGSAGWRQASGRGTGMGTGTGSSLPMGGQGWGAPSPQGDRDGCRRAHAVRRPGNLLLLKHALGGKKNKQQTPPKKKPNPNQQALPELEASTLPGARRAPREGRVSVLLSVCAWLCVVSGGTEVLPPPSVTPAGVCVCLRSSSDLRGWRGERWEAAAPPAPPALCRARMLPPPPAAPSAPPRARCCAGGSRG